MLQGVTLPGPEYQALAANQALAHHTPAQPVFQVQGIEHDHETTDVSSLVDILAEESACATIIATPEEVLVAEPASHPVNFQPGHEEQISLLAYTDSNHKKDIDSLEQQSVVIVEQAGSHEPDVGVSRCAFCECGTSCQDFTYSCCKLCVAQAGHDICVCREVDTAKVEVQRHNLEVESVDACASHNSSRPVQVDVEVAPTTAGMLRLWAVLLDPSVGLDLCSSCSRVCAPSLF